MPVRRENVHRRSACPLPYGGPVSRPLLFLDVDGPLNPYAAKPERRPEGCTTIRVAVPLGRPLRVWLNPSHGPALLALGFELCWATTWTAEANRWIGPVLGLPELPYVDFDRGLPAERRTGIHWKTEAIVAYAGGTAVRLGGRRTGPGGHPVRPRPPPRPGPAPSRRSPDRAAGRRLRRTGGVPGVPAVRRLSVLPAGRTLSSAGAASCVSCGCAGSRSGRPRPRCSGGPRRRR